MKPISRMSNPGITPSNRVERHVIYSWSIHQSIHPSVIPFLLCGHTHAVLVCDAGHAQYAIYTRIFKQFGQGLGHGGLFEEAK